MTTLVKRYNKQDDLLELINLAHLFFTGSDNSVLAFKELLLQSKEVEEKERKGEK